MAILREEREILRAKFSSASFVPICRAIHAYLTRQWRSDGLDKDGYVFPPKRIDRFLLTVDFHPRFDEIDPEVPV